MTGLFHQLLWVVAGGIASVVAALVFVGVQMRSASRRIADAVRPR